MADPTPLEDPVDYSPFLGGALFQLFRRAHLSGQGLELATRRVVCISLFAWLPLLILVLADRKGGAGLKIPFIGDFETHVRFLIALPVLIGAEITIHKRVRSLVRCFLERGMILPAQLERFNGAIASARRARNMLSLELVLVVIVYTLGTWLWRTKVALGSASWYGTPDAGGFTLTTPGLWYAYVSIPVFQFILVRWYLRFAIWTWLLWRISRLNLRLIPAHPDRAGGLGFLGNGVYAYSPILFAQGALLSGMIANRIFYDDASLMGFKVQIAGFVAFFVAALTLPLLAFVPRLVTERRRGMAEFSALGVRYVRAFEDKWIAGGAPNDEQFLGTADIQTLADLANSTAVVSEMRPVPLGLRDIGLLVTVTLLPVLPLTLTVIPVEAIIDRLLGVLF